VLRRHREKLAEATTAWITAVHPESWDLGVARRGAEPDRLRQPAPGLEDQPPPARGDRPALKLDEQDQRIPARRVGDELADIGRLAA